MFHPSCKSVSVLFPSGTVCSSRIRRRARPRSSWRKATLCLCTRNVRTAGTRGRFSAPAGRASSPAALWRVSRWETPANKLWFPWRDLRDRPEYLMLIMPRISRHTVMKTSTKTSIFTAIVLIHPLGINDAHLEEHVSLRRPLVCVCGSHLRSSSGPHRFLQRPLHPHFSSLL